MRQNFYRFSSKVSFTCYFVLPARLMTQKSILFVLIFKKLSCDNYCALHQIAGSLFISITIQDSLSEDDVMLLDTGKEVSYHFLENT